MSANAEHIQDAALEMEALLDETHWPEDGALVVFGGTVRRHNAGRQVTRLDYSVYPPLAERAFSEIERETERRYRVSTCRIRHRVGELTVGEMSVLVVVRAPHRAEAFEAARHAIEAVKHSAPIWKREQYSDGSHVFVQGCSLHDEDGSP